MIIFAMNKIEARIKTLTTKPKQRFILSPQDHTVLVRQTSKWGQIFLCRLWDWERLHSRAAHGCIALMKS